MTKLKQHITTARHWLAAKLVQALYGQEMLITDQDKLDVAGCLVMWYVQDGFRHFVLINPYRKNGTAKARFPSYFGLKLGQDAATALSDAVKTQLGDVFFRSLDKQLLEADRIAVAPTFRYTDDVTGATIPVQALIWAIQITPSQAELIQGADGISCTTVAEYAMLGSQVAPTHKAVYQHTLRHIQGNTNSVAPNDMLEKLEEMLVASDSSSRTIH